MEQLKAKHPDLLIDSNERGRLCEAVIRHGTKMGLTIARRELLVGDYLLGDACVESKSIADLFQSSHNGHIWRQLENMDANYTYGEKRDFKSSKILYNRHTSQHSKGLYLKDGSNYNGKFHVHLNDGMAMSGSEHTLDSQELYYYPIKNGISSAKLISTKNTSSIPQVSRLNRPNRKRRR